MTGSSKQQTTTTNNAPWSGAQPALNLALYRAQEMYKNNEGGDIFRDSTVVPWSQQSQQAMNTIESNANANSGRDGALSSQYQDIINRGGLTAAQQGAMTTLQGMPASGLGDAQTRALGGLQNLASNPFNSYQQNALGNTQSTANSNFDINANPAFQDVLKQAQGAARDSVNMSSAGAGRYGSGAHQGTLAREVGDLTSRMVGQEYNNWQNRRDAANTNLFNMGQTGIGTQMNANTGAANIGQQGFANRTNTQNAIFDMGQRGVDNLGDAYAGLNRPAQDLMQVGAMNEDLATRQMNDRLRVFNEQQNRGWDQLGRLNAIASGAGSLGGTQTTAAPGQNPFLTALGYGAGAGGLLGSFL